VRLFVARHQHDRDLVVRPGARADPGLFAHRADPAFGRRDQPRGQAPAAPEREFGAVGIARGLDHFIRRDQLDLRAGRESSQHGRAQETVLDDPSHRLGLAALGCGLAVIEMQEQRAWSAVVAGVGDADVEDRLGLVRQVRPDAQRGEQTVTGIGDGGGAPVEACVGEGFQRHPVDQHRAEPGFTRGEGQQAAVQAGAHDREIEPIAVHAPINGSRPGRRQLGAVRIWQTAAKPRKCPFPVNWHVHCSRPIRNRTARPGG
jgi:hypothetical protein